MALVHYLYVGHFIPDQGWVRFDGGSPVVTSPLRRPSAAALLQKRLGPGAALDGPLDEWGLTIASNFIVCDQLGSPPDVLHFVADYAEREGATILDMGAFAILTPEQVRESAAAIVRGQPA